MNDSLLLRSATPAAASQEIRAVLQANAANKAAGKQLLRELPLWQKLAARARSWALLLIIYATFWVSSDVSRMACCAATYLELDHTTALVLHCIMSGVA